MLVRQREYTLRSASLYTWAGWPLVLSGTSDTYLVSYYKSWYPKQICKELCIPTNRDEGICKWGRWCNGDTISDKIYTKPTLGLSHVETMWEAHQLIDAQGLLDQDVTVSKTTTVSLSFVSALRWLGLFSFITRVSPDGWCLNGQNYRIPTYIVRQKSFKTFLTPPMYLHGAVDTGSWHAWIVFINWTWPAAESTILSTIGKRWDQNRTEARCPLMSSTGYCDPLLEPYSQLHLHRGWDTNVGLQWLIGTWRRSVDSNFWLDLPYESARWVWFFPMHTGCWDMYVWSLPTVKARATQLNFIYGYVRCPQAMVWSKSS